MFQIFPRMWIKLFFWKFFEKTRFLTFLCKKVVQNGPKSGFSVFSKNNIKMFQIFLRIWIHLFFFKKNEKKLKFLPFYVKNGPDLSQNLFLVLLFFLAKNTGFDFFMPKKHVCTSWSKIGETSKRVDATHGDL